MSTPESNPFVVDPADYEMDSPYLPTAYSQIVEYLVRMEGCTEEEAREFVDRKRQSENPDDVKFRTFDPKVKLLIRDRETEDREAVVVNWSQYEEQKREEKLVTTPAWTSYYNHGEKRSVSGEYIVVNLGIRQAAKHKMFLAKMNKDKPEAAYRNSEQSSAKYFNNSLSGSRASKGNIFFCKSAHPSLTSPCRTATGVANAHNEKFIGGNRYYPNRDTVIANIIAHVKACPSEQVAETCARYGLAYPTVDQLVTLIGRGFNRYSLASANQFRELLSTLTDEERAYFAYSGDLYHLHVMNPEFTCTMLDELSEKNPSPSLDFSEAYDNSHGDVKLHAEFLCGDLIKGKKIGDVRKEDPETFNIVAGTAAKFNELLKKYEGIIRTFWLCELPPNNASHTPFIARSVIPLSDTDSTVFTLQHWTTVVQGKTKVDFSHKSSCISSAVTYITAQMVRHWLAIFTTNSGMPAEFRPKISMKNEYYSPLLALTNASKHYAMYSTVCEGNILPEPQLDIKGVNMRNSSWPKEIRDTHEDWIKGTFETIIENGTIPIHDFLRTPYSTERRLLDSLGGGRYEYLSKIRINTESSYKKPESSNYVHFNMWQAVFAPKYGSVPTPPWRGISVPVKLHKASQLKAWVASIKDPGVKARAEEYFLKTKPRAWTMLIIPEVIGQQTGIPEEVIQVMDMRRILSATLKGFYMTMAAYGIELGDEKQSKLLVDVYAPPEVTGIEARGPEASL